MRRSTTIRKKFVNNTAQYSLLTQREKKVLSQLLKGDETIESVVRTTYGIKRALVLATSKRMIVLDTRLTSVYVRFISYESIKKVDYRKVHFRSLLAVKVHDKFVVFKSHSNRLMKKLADWVSQKITGMLHLNAFSKSPLQTFVEDSIKGQLRVTLPRHRHGKFSARLYR